MSVRIKIKPLLWLAMLLMLVGCNGRLSLIKDAARFYRSTVSFPDKMLRIENGDTMTVAMPELVKPLLIHYYGPEECSECALNLMRDNLRLTNYSKANGLFDFVVILAPMRDERQTVIEKAMGMSLPLCIYIDSSHYLASEGLIPSNPITHTFLITVNHSPVYFGNPLEDNKHKEDFENRLKKYL